MGGFAADFKARGYALVFIGTGSPHYAKVFRQEYLAGVECQVLCDPTLESYRLMKFPRGWRGLFQLRTLRRGLEAFGRGFRQSPKVQGDALQNGGVGVIDERGDWIYRFVSRGPGDHPAPEEIVQSIPFRKLSDPAATLDL